MTHPTDALRLVSCPFCGGDMINTRSQEMTKGPAYYWHKCETCGAESEGDYGEDVAVAAWNRRAAPASPLPGGGCLGAKHLSGAIKRLTGITAGDEVEAVYTDFPFPIHTFHADLRALLSLLPAAPTGEPK